MLLQTFVTYLILTKSSGPKRLAVAFIAPIFAGFCACHIGLRTLTARYDSSHTSQLMVAISHGCGQFHPQTPVGKFAHTCDA
jgi:hypothetical protein